MFAVVHLGNCQISVKICRFRRLTLHAFYELRLYWLCRQHADLKDAEEEWGIV